MWTFHLYIATFQQHLHMEYFSLSRSDITRLVVSIIQDVLDRWLLLPRKLLIQWFLLVKFKSSLRKVLWSPPWLDYPLRNICVTNNDEYIQVSLVISMVISSSTWLITGFVTRLTRLVSLVEQELLTLQEHWSLSPVFSGVRVARSFRVFCVVFCRSLFVLLSLFLCPLCCVFLRIVDTDYKR